MKIGIATSAEGEPSGYDSAIIRAPADWYCTAPDGERDLVLNIVGRDLRARSERFAAALGERLHSAEWTITSDLEQVAALGMMHDCADCRDGVNRALEFLRENPAGEVAVGQLWWA